MIQWVLVIIGCALLFTAGLGYTIIRAANNAGSYSLLLPTQGSEPVQFSFYPTKGHTTRIEAEYSYPVRITVERIKPDKLVENARDRYFVRFVGDGYGFKIGSRQDINVNEITRFKFDDVEVEPKWSDEKP